MLKITQQQLETLLNNGSAQNREHDHMPVVKLFTPDSDATWLLASIDPDSPSYAFGLCDLGHGFPELGYVSLDELSALRGAFGLSVERDEYFEPLFPLSIYAEAARHVGHIVTNERILLEIDQKRHSVNTNRVLARRPE